MHFLPYITQAGAYPGFIKSYTNTHKPKTKTIVLSCRERWFCFYRSTFF